MPLLPAPYLGRLPYLAVCHTPADWPAVWPMLEQLAGAGLRLWYDWSGDNSLDNAQERTARLQKAGMVLLCISDAFLQQETMRELLCTVTTSGRPAAAVFLSPLTLELPAARLHLSALPQMPLSELEAPGVLPDWITSLTGGGALRRKWPERQPELLSLDEQQGGSR